MILYNDDCFNIFPKIEDKSINLFLLDLPYANKKFGNCTACAWDTPIDLEKMWVEIKRMMKPNAIIIFFCNTKFGYSLIHSNPKWFKYEITWKKGNKKVGFLGAKKQPLKQTEFLYIFKKEQGIYNPQMTYGNKPYKDDVRKKAKKCGVYGEDMIAKPVINKGERYPTNILDFSPPYSKKKTFHATEKPVDLLEWLIKTYTNEEDLVMDFCMGSGSTGQACKNTNRKFIGIEKDEEIFKLAEQRLKN
jgi:DNA modification methylase